MVLKKDLLTAVSMLSRLARPDAGFEEVMAPPRKGGQTFHPSRPALCAQGVPA